MFRNALPATALVAVVLSAGHAAAQCLPSPPIGATVTCSGTDSDGFVFGTADALSVTVESGASVTNAAGARAIDIRDSNIVEILGTVTGDGADAIRVRDNGLVALDGAVTGVGADAIRLRDNGRVFVLGGAVTATGSTGDGIDARDGLEANVFSTIDAGKDGVNARDSAKIEVTTSGRVLAGDDGLQVRHKAEITNRGLIDAMGEGINAEDNLTLIQLGTIQGRDDAVKGGESLSVFNTGTIANVQTAADVAAMGEAQDGIDLDSGFIDNRVGGRITSTFGDAIDFDPSDIPFNSAVDNFGLIKGGNRAVETDPLNKDGQWVINRAGARIEAGDAVALNLGGGGDRYTHFAGSGGLSDAVLIGGILFGEGDDLLDIEGRPTGRQLGGRGALIDGGLGTDRAFFEEFTTADIGGRRVGKVFKLALGTGADPFVLWLLGFDQFTFGTETLSRDELTTRLGGIAPIPLPASAVLLAGGLGLLGLIRRRKRR